MERSQFTFYKSYFQAIMLIKSKNTRCAIYDSICAYALQGKEPDLNALPDAAAIAFELIRPTLDAANKRALNGKQGGYSATSAEANCKQIESKPEANCKQIKSKLEANYKQSAREKEGEEEIEKEGETEIESECYSCASAREESKTEADAFEIFWEAFPRKSGDFHEAMLAFDKVVASGVTLNELLNAVDEQKRSAKWTDQDGRYIPSPEKWLKNRGWTEHLPQAPAKTVTTFFDVAEEMKAGGVGDV